VRGQVASALAAGIEPTAPEAVPAVAALTRACEAVTESASPAAGADTAGARRGTLLSRLRAADDPRRDRYMRLLAVVNGWPPQPALAPALAWAEQAVTAHPQAAGV
jgi:hypothetical protein